MKWVFSLSSKSTIERYSPPVSTESIIQIKIKYPKLKSEESKKKWNVYIITSHNNEHIKNIQFSNFSRYI